MCFGGPDGLDRANRCNARDSCIWRLVLLRWLLKPTEALVIPPAAIKPNRKDVGYYMRLSAEDKALLLKMGGVRWIRRCIELAREGETK